MKKLTLQEIANACGGTLTQPQYANKTITAITTDSRRAADNTLFIPLKGERADGHDFILQTFQSGAVCSLSEKEIDTENPVIMVESCYQAIKDIAEYYRSLFNIPVIGITGSVGKTSTKEMIASVLSQSYNVHKTQGNFNNELGVPLTIFGLEEEHQVAVVEMGISDFGEMTRLSKIVKPTISVITNIGDCHLENLGDRNGVLKAKTEMFKYLAKDGRVFLNGDDSHLSAVTAVNGSSPVFYGINKGNNTYYSENINNMGIKGISCTLCTPTNRLEVTIPAIGTYMVANALVAVAIGEYLGMEPAQIKKGIESYKTVGSRDGVIETEYITVIDDCYNANPVSVKGGIDTLTNFSGRTVCILGDMKELGANSRQLHCDTGKYAKDKGVDVLVAVGNDAVDIAEGAKGGNTAVYYFENVAEAIDSLKSIIKRNDTVLVKASRAMRLEQVVNALKELKA